MPKQNKSKQKKIIYPKDNNSSDTKSINNSASSNEKDIKSNNNKNKKNDKKRKKKKQKTKKNKNIKNIKKINNNIDSKDDKQNFSDIETENNNNIIIYNKESENKIIDTSIIINNDLTIEEKNLFYKEFENYDLQNDEYIEENISESLLEQNQNDNNDKIILYNMYLDLKEPK